MRKKIIVPKNQLLRFENIFNNLSNIYVTKKNNTSYLINSFCANRVGFFSNKLDNNSLNCLFHLYDTHTGMCNASVCCVYLYVHVSVIHTRYIVANRGQYVRSSPREQCGLFTVT